MNKKEYQSAYYKLKYASNEEYRNRVLETARKWREENKEQQRLHQLKYRQRKYSEKYDYLFIAPWSVNIIERPNK
jgi:hypothetical protein